MIRRRFEARKAPVGFMERNCRSPRQTNHSFFRPSGVHFRSSDAISVYGRRVIVGTSTFLSEASAAERRTGRAVKRWRDSVEHLASRVARETKSCSIKRTILTMARSCLATERDIAKNNADGYEFYVHLETVRGSKG